MGAALMKKRNCLLLFLLALLLVLPAGAHDEYNEDQWLFIYEQTFCHNIIPLMKALGTANAVHCWGWSKSKDLPHTWRFDDNKATTDAASYVGRIHFKAFGYFKGSPKVGESQVYNLSADSDPDIQTFPPEAVSVEETIKTTVEESETREDTYETETSFDVTASQEASVTAGFKAGTAGVEVEASATLTIGFEESYGKSFGRSNTEATTKTETKEIETRVEVPSNAREIILTIEKRHERVITEVVENGYADFSGCIEFYRWAGRTTNETWLRNSVVFQKHGANKLCWENVQHLLDIIRGNEPREYPHMAGFLDWACAEANHGNWHAAGACNFYSWLNVAAHRHVKLHREQIVDSKNAGRVSVTYGQ